MTALNSCNPGSRGSSTGSSLFHNCYPQKALCRKGFRPLGSRGSSTSNFSAEKSLFGCKLEICLQVMIAVGINTAVTATFATYAAKSLVITGLSGVAVPGNAATRVAIHCYPQHQFRKEENR